MTRALVRLLEVPRVEFAREVGLPLLRKKINTPSNTGHESYLQQGRETLIDVLSFESYPLVFSNHRRLRFPFDAQVFENSIVGFRHPIGRQSYRHAPRLSPTYDPSNSEHTRAMNCYYIRKLKIAITTFGYDVDTKLLSMALRLGVKASSKRGASTCDCTHPGTIRVPNGERFHPETKRPSTVHTPILDTNEITIQPRPVEQPTHALA